MAKLPWAPQPALPHGAASIRIPLAPPDTRHPVKIAHRAVEPRRKSLTAASKVLEKPKGIAAAYGSETLDWQREAWGFYNITGELRFGANLYGNGISRIQLCPAKKTKNGPAIRLSEAKQLNSTDKLFLQLWDEVTSAQGEASMKHLAAVLLFIAGEGLLVGLPAKPKDRRRSGPRGRKLMDYTWRVYSRDDVRRDNGMLHIDGETYDEGDVVLVKFWRPDPQWHRMPDSPTRGVLPILRELNGLTMYTSALIDSRLAGAGVLILPNSATVLGATAPEDDQEEDPTVAAIIEAMVTPIKDRSSASSVVPLIMTVPDEAAGEVRHLTFSSTLESTVKELRDELIRRLALGLDMPAEQLLGMALAASSHWGSWMVAEDTVRLHFMPGLQLFATAILTDLLIPMLIESGVDEEEAELYFFELDGEDLVSRPNSFPEALELYRVGALSLEALLSAGGFEQTDAPAEDNQQDRAVQMALKICQVTPTLFQEPGLPAIISQIRAALAGEDASTAPPEAMPTPPGQPQDSGSEGRPSSPQQGQGERGAPPRAGNPGPPQPGKNLPGTPR